MNPRLLGQVHLLRGLVVGVMARLVLYRDQGGTTWFIRA